jgi:small-conductance mechanosensitive channel
VRKTRTEVDDWVAEVAAQTRRWFWLILALYVGALALTLPENVRGWTRAVAVITLLLQVAIWGNEVIALWFARYEKAHLDKDASRVTTLHAASFIARTILYAIVILLALDNIPGVQVTTLIASLGIGGIAVALAVQNILADLFASLTIALDQPFVIGDFIIVGDYMGTVEHIGLKTTRLRSLSGEQLVFSNTDLLDSRIRNYKRMADRRVAFSIGVTYETPYDKLQAIPAILEEIIGAQPQVRFDRAHFSNYGDSSLNFEIVYYVLDPDYNLFMDIQQAINLALYQRFEQEGIEFAYPTQRLYIDLAT